MYTSSVGNNGTLTILETLRNTKDVKFYQASSSEMFGGEEKQ